MPTGKSSVDLGKTARVSGLNSALVMVVHTKVMLLKLSVVLCMP